MAEDALTGPSVTRMRDAAREHEMIIIAPIYEKCRNTELLFNTAVVIESHGEVLGTYRKTHIPQGTNERGTFYERFYYGASGRRHVRGASRQLLVQPLLPRVSRPAWVASASPSVTTATSKA